MCRARRGVQDVPEASHNKERSLCALVRFHSCGKAEPKARRQEGPKAYEAYEYLATVKLHQIQHRYTHSGGKLVNMLAHVESLRRHKLDDLVFVGVWSFNDFHGSVRETRTSSGDILFHLPDEFFNNLNRLIDCLRRLLPS